MYSFKSYIPTYTNILLSTCMYSNDIVTHRLSEFYILLKHRSLSSYSHSVLDIAHHKKDKDRKLYSLARCTPAYILWQKQTVSFIKQLWSFSRKQLLKMNVFAEKEDEKYCIFKMFSHEKMLTCTGSFFSR